MQEIRPSSRQRTSPRRFLTEHPSDTRNEIVSHGVQSQLHTGDQRETASRSTCSREVGSYISGACVTWSEFIDGELYCELHAGKPARYQCCDDSIVALSEYTGSLALVRRSRTPSTGEARRLHAGHPNLYHHDILRGAAIALASERSYFKASWSTLVLLMEKATPL